jgi:hypothetical protein
MMMAITPSLKASKRVFVIPQYKIKFIAADMVSNASIHKLALSYPETDAHPHFHRVAFRVKKKIFATLHAEKRLLMVKLTPADQSVFCLIDKQVLYPVPGGWGRSGATYIELKKAKLSLVKDVLQAAWLTTTPAKLASSFPQVKNKQL